MHFFEVGLPYVFGIFGIVKSIMDIIVQTSQILRIF